MSNIRQVRANDFIAALAAELKKSKEIRPPAAAVYIKSGVSAERPPIQPDFWWIRSAAMLRKLYLSPGPLGVQRLRTIYGSKRRRGHKPAHHRKAGGKFIRLMLQQLEKEGYVAKAEAPKKGRIITPKGQRMLDRVAKGLK